MCVLDIVPVIVPVVLSYTVHTVLCCVAALLYLCSSICSTSYIILGTGTIPGRLSTVEKLKTLPKISRPSWTVGGLQSIIFFQNFTTSTRSRKRTHHESWWVRAISTFVKILHALSTIFNFRYFLKKTNFVFKKNLVVIFLVPPSFFTCTSVHY